MGMRLFVFVDIIPFLQHDRVIKFYISSASWCVFSGHCLSSNIIVRPLHRHLSDQRKALSFRWNIVSNTNNCSHFNYGENNMPIAVFFYKSTSLHAVWSTLSYKLSHIRLLSAAWSWFRHVENQEYIYMYQTHISVSIIHKSVICFRKY